MSKSQHANPINYIERFTPLNRISNKYRSRLESSLKLLDFNRGDTILRKSDDQSFAHFLVKGSVEIRFSFDDRIVVNSEDRYCDDHLERDLVERSTVKALSGCTVLVACNEKIDHLLIMQQGRNIFYKNEVSGFEDSSDLVSYHHNASKENSSIDYNICDRWDDVFCRSSLAEHLPNDVTHQILSKLEDQPVVAGETVMRANSWGDYFYIIKKGSANIQTHFNGSSKDERIAIDAGGYFGDEGLIANTTQNATVTMTTDGVLGRLDSQSFNQLIKLQLVHPLPSTAKSDQTEIKVVDVRLALEFRKGHYKGSHNIPVHFLRAQLSKLRPSKLYVIAPAHDSRADLATYIMRKAGYRAYLLPDTGATP